MFSAREALYNIAEQAPKEEQNSLMKVLMAKFNTDRDLHLKYTTAFFVTKMASKIESDEHVTEAVNILLDLRQDANPNIVTASEKAIIDFVVRWPALYKIKIAYAIDAYIKQKDSIESIVVKWIGKYAEIYDAGNLETIKYCQNAPS